MEAVLSGVRPTSGVVQQSRRAEVVHDLHDERPRRRDGRLNRRHPAQHLRALHVVIAPASTLRACVLEQRLQAIHRIRETRLRRLLRLELLPQRPQTRRLIPGSSAKTRSAAARSRSAFVTRSCVS